jgi:hypothetical protein
MEKTITHINGSPVAERFVINDAAVGKTFNVRDCTDSQLQRALQSATQASEQLTMQIQQLINQQQIACSSACVFAYELDRRAKSLKVVS